MQILVNGVGFYVAFSASKGYSDFEVYSFKEKQARSEQQGLF